MSVALRVAGAVGAGALALALTACGGSSHASSSPTDATDPTATTSVDGPFDPASSTPALIAPSVTTTAKAGSLLALLGPAPAGFVKSTDPEDKNGALSAADWENIAGPGSATKYHFSSGAVVTYVGSSDLPNEVIYQLVRFASSADAAQALADATSQVPTGTVTVGTDAAIPGSTTLTPKAAPSDGSLADYSVVAAKGDVVMFADYYSQTVEPTYPAYAEKVALAQYQLI